MMTSNAGIVIIALITRVRDNDSQLGDFAIKYDLSGDPDGSPDFFNRYRLLPENELSVGFRHLVIEINLGFCGEEAICPHCRQQVHYEIVNAPVAGMHQ